MADLEMTVATYHRVPRSDEQFGLEDLRVLQLVRQHDWTLVGSYTDDVAAGERPGLARLIDDAKRHRFDGVVVYRFEQLYRSRRELEAMLDELALDLVTVIPLPALPRTMRGRPPAEFDVAHARNLALQGRTLVEIGAELGVGSATVHRALTSSIVRKPPHRSRRSTISNRTLDLPFAALAPVG